MKRWGHVVEEGEVAPEGFQDSEVALELGRGGSHVSGDGDSGAGSVATRHAALPDVGWEWLCRARDAVVGACCCHG